MRQVIVIVIVPIWVWGMSNTGVGGGASPELEEQMRWSAQRARLVDSIEIRASGSERACEGMRMRCDVMG